MLLTYANFGEWAIDQAIAEGFDGIRCDDSNGRSEPELVPLFVDQPIRPLFLLHDAARMQPLLDALLLVQDRLLEPSIELYNELEGGRVTPQIYVEGISAVYHDARARGFQGRIIAGGLANLSRDSLDFYARGLPLLPADRGPEGLTIGFHEYPYGVQKGGRKPWPGTGSPDDAIRQLMTLANGRDVVNTEWGWHTHPEEEGFSIRPDGPDPDSLPDVTFPRTVQLTDEEVYDFLKTDLRRYAALGLPLAVIYQWRDGVDDNYLSKFGLHTADGFPKRQLDAVKDWRT